MRFGVMGTTTHVVVVGGDEDVLYAHARTRLQELDRKWSRYSSRSEVAQLSRRGGRLTMVSIETYALVERAVDAWWRTAGRFDPTTPRSSDDCHDVRRAPEPPTGSDDRHGGRHPRDPGRAFERDARAPHDRRACARGLRPRSPRAGGATSAR